MVTKNEIDMTYLKTAELFAKLSKAKNAQVGACLVTTKGVLLPGINGTIPGGNNNCEHDGITKQEVLHSELNSLLKACKEGISVLGATMYITLSPCIQCSAMMIQAGIKRVVYRDKYRCLKGLDLLDEAGIIHEQFTQKDGLNHLN